MRTIKIFALPSHQTKERTSGVDFARIIQPMKALNGYTDEDTKFEVDIYNIDDSTDWLHVAKNYDLIYFNYLNSPWGFAAMGAMARRHGVPMVMDLDDNLWSLRSDNAAQTVYYKGSDALRNFTAICNEVDYVTCTNRYLKNVVINNTRKHAEEIKVLPNYVDLKMYNHRTQFRKDFQIRLTHFGSTTHFHDLNDEEFNKGIDRIFTEYPNVVLRMVGAFIPKYRKRWGMRYENAYGAVDIYDWVKNKFPQYMDETDILVVPLIDDLYNRCKSHIKFLEASSAGIPGVWQKIRQYEEIVDGENGMLARTADQWYEAIKKLIDDEQLRRTMGERAFQTVKEDWQMKHHVGLYADFFKEVIDNKS